MPDCYSLWFHVLYTGLIRSTLSVLLNEEVICCDFFNKIIDRMQAIDLIFV